MSIRGIYRDGQVVLNQPTDWPDGLRVNVMPSMEDDCDDILGMTEEEQGDDPASIAKWMQEFQAIPALNWSDEEHRRREEWQARMKAYNVDAVRKQFEEGIK